MRSRFISVVSLALPALPLLVGCAASGFKVHRVTPETPRFDVPVMYYALPRTVLRITIPVTKEDVTSPPVCTPDMLAKEIRAEDAATRARWERREANRKPGDRGEQEPQARDAAREAERLVKSLGVTLGRTAGPGVWIGEPAVAARQEVDPSQIFAIELTEDFLRDTRRSFQLTEQGFLASAQIESTDTALDLAAKAVSAGASVASALFTAGGETEKGECQEAALDIQSLREKQMSILSGGTNMGSISKDTMEYMLGELRARERGLLGRFIGGSEVTQADIVCDLIPGDDPARAAAKPETLFRYLPAGIVALDRRCVAPPELTARSEANDAGTAVSVSLSVIGAELAQAVKRTQRIETEEVRGIAYRVPAQAVFSVSDGGRERLRTTLVVAQYGTVATLPGDSDISSLSASYTLTLSPTAGALMNVSTSSMPVEPAPR